MPGARKLFEDIRNLLDGNIAARDTHALWLLEHITGLTPAAILADTSSEINTVALLPLIERINQGEPIQYVLEEAWFYGRNFFVNREVLIPRPETELLVEEIRKRWKEPGPLMVDIGTGSGCIAISLALAFAGATVYGTDVAKGSLEVARKNQEMHHTHVNFLEHDMLHDSARWPSVDIIVSNPPYIRESERITMHDNVRKFEPERALFVPDEDPLKFYYAIARLAQQSLQTRGFVLCEINEALGNETAGLFRFEGFTHVEVLPDLAGKDRMVFAGGLKPK